VISQRNRAEVEGLVSLADRFGVYALFQPEHAQKTGRAAAVTPVPPALVQTLIRRRRRGAGILNSKEYLRGLVLPPVNEARRDCNAGRTYFSIDPYGQLHPCVDVPAMGHVLEDAVEAISADVSRAAVRACPGCWYCFRGEADATLPTAV
jgi:hypothetical protein